MICKAKRIYSEKANFDIYTGRAYIYDRAKNTKDEVVKNLTIPQKKPIHNSQFTIRGVQKNNQTTFLLSKYHIELSERVRNHQNLSRLSGVYHKHLPFVQDTIEDFGDLYK